MTSRFLSLWFPRLGAERWLRLGACAPDRPFATVTLGRGSRLGSLNAAAEADGLWAGQTLAEAMDACGDLAVLPDDPAATERLLGALARAAGRLGVRARIGSPDLLTVRIDRLPPVIGDESTLMARALTAAISAGLSARPGIADTAGAAEALARCGAGTAAQGTAAHGTAGRIAARGGIRQALAPLPVDALRLGPAARRRLYRLGVRRIGEIADLPPVAIRRYLGAEIADRMEDVLGAAAPLAAGQDAGQGAGHSAAPAAGGAVVHFAAVPMAEPARRRA